MKLYLYLFICLVDWFRNIANFSTDWFLFMPFKKQTMQIKKLMQMYNVFVKKNEIYYTTACIWTYMLDFGKYWKMTHSLKPIH